MASKRNDNAPTVKVGSTSFLDKYIETDNSIQDLREHRVLPKARFVQKTSADELKTAFKEGSVVLLPGNALIAPVDEPFQFIPLFFFVEFTTQSDRRDQSSPKIRDRSVDPTSMIAIKSRDSNRRTEEYPGGPAKEPWMMRHVEHFVFAGVLVGDHQFAEEPFTLSFEKGEFLTGKSFISAITMRKTADRRNIPLWAQIWQFAAKMRTRNGNSWYGFDFSAPEQSIIDESIAEKMRELHLDLAQLFKDKKLSVDRSDVHDDDAATAASDGKSDADRGY